MDKLKDLIKRIIASKKFFYALVPVLANLIVAITGHDPTTPLILAIDAAFALLLLIQFLLDLRWGSPSDGTGRAGYSMLPVLAFVFALSLGCSFSFAGYERTTDGGRSILAFGGEAGESFCVDKLSVPVILDMVNLGWGQYSCERGEVIRPPTELPVD